MKLDITLSGIKILRSALRDIKENAEFSDSITDEYKAGFFDCIDGIIKAHNGIIEDNEAGTPVTFAKLLEIVYKIYCIFFEYVII